LWLFPAAPGIADTTVLQLQELLRASQFAPKRGVFYEIKSESNTVYLFGTVHIGKAEFYPLNASVIRAIAASDSFYVEVDITQPAIVKRLAQGMRHARSPADGRRLDERLPPALMGRVNEALRVLGASSEDTNSLEPWEVRSALIGTCVLGSAYSPRYSTELYLTGVAKRLNKKVVGLESVDEHVRASEEAEMATLTDEEQKALLEQTLSDLENGRLCTKVFEPINAWATGDRVAIEHAIDLHEKNLVGEPGKEYRQKVMDDRNKNMAERIEQLVRVETSAFVAVGTEHLIGRDGVVDRLRRNGLSVREL
jgi:uncharacterized protein YbaP (TraB family)